MIKTNNLFKILIFSGIIVISIIGIVYNNYLNTLPADYTVGVIEKFATPASGNQRAIFRYIIEKEAHTNSVSTCGYETLAQIGKRFLVEFPEGYPSEGLILFSYPINDSVIPPPNGWDEIPDFIKNSKSKP